MDRLTTNKPAGEMTMTELAHNGCYRGEDGWARYRDYDTDIDARDLARKLLERYEPEQPLPEENRALEDLLFDELQYGPLDHAGALVALVYNMIWSMADLRERLAAYEDTGLEPDEVRGLLTQHRTERCESADYDCVELGRYRRAEAEGRLIVLPCKVGDVVYAIRYRPWTGIAVEDVKVLAIGAALRENKTIVIVSSTKDDVWGETVFATRKEAEAALGRSKSHGD